MLDEGFSCYLYLVVGNVILYLNLWFDQVEIFVFRVVEEVSHYHSIMLDFCVEVGIILLVRFVSLGTFIIEDLHLLYFVSFEY